MKQEEIEKEIWKDIPGYEGDYQVSNLGRVKSFKCKKIKILNKYFNKSTKRFKVCLNSRSLYIHKLVAMAFLDHTPCGHKIVVDHINNDPLDNRLVNLQLITSRENTSKDRKVGTSKYTGVSYKCNKWLSRIKINNVDIHIAYFSSEKLASDHYQVALCLLDEFENPKQFRELVKSYFI